MNPMSLRPLSVSEVLDTAVSLYRKSFATVVPIAAVFTIPLALLMAVFLDSQQANIALLENSPNSIQAQQAASSLFTALGAYVLLSLLMSSLVQGATTFVYGEAYAGRQTPIGRASKVGLSKALQIVLLSLAIGVPVLLGFIFCIVPGVFLMTVWYVSQPVLVLENKGIFASMSRSKSLVEGYFGKTLGILVIATLLNFVLSWALSIPLSLVTDSAGIWSDAANTNVALNGLVNGCLSAIVAPFAAAFAVVAYFDLRVRKEALDIDRLVSQLPPVEDAPEGFKDPGDPFGLG